MTVKTSLMQRPLKRDNFIIRITDSEASAKKWKLPSLKPRKLYWNYLIAGVMRNRGAAGMMGCRLLGKV